MALAGAWMLLPAHLQAQSLLDEVHTVAAADRAVPVEHTFTVATAGTYTVTLTDLGAQLQPTAPLASVKLAITSGSTLVGMPLTSAGSTSFNATAGTYVIHVVGLPGSTAGSGPIGIQVTDASSKQIAAFSDTLALPSTGFPNNEGVLDDSFSVTTSGNYLITLSDFQLPHSLQTLTLAITQQGGALVTTLPGGANPVSLQTGVTYRIFAVGQAPTTLNAGLYGVNVTAVGSSTPIYSHAVPVGAVALVGSATLSAGTYTLSVSDLKFPNATALSQVGAAVTLNGQAVAEVGAAAGTPGSSFTATANTYQVFALGIPAAAGQGSYAVAVQPSSGAAALSVARAVSAAGGLVSAYSYDTSAVASETYAFAVADFGIPANLTSVTAAAVQSGMVLSTLTAAGAVNTLPGAGPVSLLVFAQRASSGGLFGVDWTAQGAGSATFEATQAVGQLFSASKVTVTTGGSYNVTVGDVGFPAPFGSLTVIVTRGTSRAGSIFGGGTFSFQAVGGDYHLNFIAQPTGSDEAGTYSMSVAPTPPAPTLTLQSSATSVASGGTVQLQWSSQNATSCTATGGWSGNQPVSGTMTTSALTSTTTFTLNCTGAGGTTAQSVTVNITAPSGGSGGGGVIDQQFLVLLLFATAVRALALYILRAE